MTSVKLGVRLPVAGARLPPGMRSQLSADVCCQASVG
jgi:hypothetical protein